MQTFLFYSLPLLRRSSDVFDPEWLTVHRGVKPERKSLRHQVFTSEH